MGNYVYKYVSDGEVVYIGKNDSDIYQRIYQHSLDERFKSIPNCEIYYCVLANRIMSDVVESELIRRYKPRMNKAKMSNWDGLPFEEPEWHKFDTAEEIKCKVKKHDQIKKKKEEKEKLRHNSGDKYWAKFYFAEGFAKMIGRESFKSKKPITKDEIDGIVNMFRVGIIGLYDDLVDEPISFNLISSWEYSTDIDDLDNPVGVDEEKWMKSLETLLFYR